MEVVYFILCVLQPICLPIPEMVTVLWGSVEIGPIKSFILGVVGAILGIGVMYWIAKKGSNFLIRKMKCEKKVALFQEYVCRYKIYIIGILFIVPILPDEIICIGSPFVGIKYSVFMGIAVISKIISVGMIAFSGQIARICSLNRVELIIMELVAIFIVAKFYTRREKRRDQDTIMSN
jgi:uncharacterized membrane protein YdjX (TVP38/TMEM64 family)|nr:VTT domain-containing protein [uncultured Lachnoclostridium sp.]